MTTRKDDAEVIERMERGEAPATDEAATREPYQRLMERIADLDVVEPPPGWVERAVERWDRSAVPPSPGSGRLLAWGGIGAAVLALAAAVVILPRCREGARRPAFSMAVTHRGAVRAGDAAVGDDLTVRTGLRADREVELRLYRDGRLVARCPGDARCTTAAGALELVYTTDLAGSYQAAEIVGPAPIAAPRAGGTLEDDNLDVRRGGATFTTRPALRVE